MIFDLSTPCYGFTATATLVSGGGLALIFQLHVMDSPGGSHERNHPTHVVFQLHVMDSAEMDLDRVVVIDFFQLHVMDSILTVEIPAGAQAYGNFQLHVMDSALWGVLFWFILL